MRVMPLFRWTGLCLLLLLESLSPPTRWWVILTDKGPALVSELMEQGASGHASTYDRPLYAGYIQQLADYGTITMQSRWLNALVLETRGKLPSGIRQFAFVKSVRPVATLRVTRESGPSTQHTTSLQASLPQVFDYGKAYEQNHALGLDFLHRKGFSGTGVRIAVLDAGFPGVDTLGAFDSLWANGQILGYRDFVDPDGDFFRQGTGGLSYHGTEVLSTLAAFVPGRHIGAAPHAGYLLCRTERADTETHLEEHHWIEAAEWAAAQGVDIIQSSLAYSEFDRGETSYEYADMDGGSTLITRAADIAAQKGILVIAGAGNLGREPWKYITAPCDGDSVLCVGATGWDRSKAAFSSVGPSADGRIKPDLAAPGQEVWVYTAGNQLAPRSGTSFASPLVAGLAACLRQAHRQRSAWDIHWALKYSGHQAARPDSLLGYGIPRGGKADSLLNQFSDLSHYRPPTARKNTPLSRPTAADLFTENPTSTIRFILNVVTIKTLEAQIREIRLMRGMQRVYLPAEKQEIYEVRARFDLEYLLPGDYYFHIVTDSYEEKYPFRWK